VASSRLFVVTQEMEQLVSENFKAIKDFKNPFLALQEQGIDRSSVKSVLIHHFQEIVDKVFNLWT
jgi:midasin